MQEFFSAFNIKESIGTFLILFAIIDVLGSTPIIIDLRNAKITELVAGRGVAEYHHGQLTHRYECEHRR